MRRCILYLLFGCCPAAAAAVIPIHQQEHREWSKADGLPASLARCIVAAPDGYVWIATDGGLARFDGIRFERFDRGNTPAITDGSLGKPIRRMWQDHRGALWIGTGSAGLVKLSGAKREELTAANGFPAKFIFTVMEDAEGSIWIGTELPGLIRLRGGDVHQ